MSPALSSVADEGAVVSAAAPIACSVLNLKRAVAGLEMAHLPKITRAGFNAGIYLEKNILDCSIEEISRVLDVNLKGAVYCSKFLGACLFKRQLPGSIVNIGSSSTHGGADAVYSTSKSGLIGLTKSCAFKFSPHVRVNAVAPGMVVDTELAKNLSEEVLGLYRSRELIKIPLVPDDVAETVSFLMSDTGRGCTGAVFDFNNGYHV